MNALTAAGAIMIMAALIGLFAVVHWIWFLMARNGGTDFAVLFGLLLLMADGAALAAVGGAV
jgi:hypothetical protein